MNWTLYTLLISASHLQHNWTYPAAQPDWEWSIMWRTMSVSLFHISVGKTVWPFSLKYTTILIQQVSSWMHLILYAVSFLCMARLAKGETALSFVTSSLIPARTLIKSHNWWKLELSRAHTPRAASASCSGSIRREMRAGAVHRLLSCAHEQRHMGVRGW
jgi:hypothetical protein